MPSNQQLTMRFRTNSIACALVQSINRLQSFISFKTISRKNIKDYKKQKFSRNTKIFNMCSMDSSEFCIFCGMQKMFDDILSFLCFAICAIFDYLHLEPVYFYCVEPLKQLINQVNQFLQIYGLSWTGFLKSVNDNIDFGIQMVAVLSCKFFDLIRISVFLLFATIGLLFYIMLQFCYIICCSIDPATSFIVKLERPIFKTPIFIKKM